MIPKERKLLLSQTYKWEDEDREAGQLVQSNQPDLEGRIPDGHPRAGTLLAVQLCQPYREGQVKQDMVRGKIPMLLLLCDPLTKKSLPSFLAAASTSRSP